MAKNNAVRWIADHPGSALWVAFVATVAIIVIALLWEDFGEAEASRFADKHPVTTESVIQAGTSGDMSVNFTDDEFDQLVQAGCEYGGSPNRCEYDVAAAIADSVNQRNREASERAQTWLMFGVLFFALPLAIIPPILMNC